MTRPMTRTGSTEAWPYLSQWSRRGAIAFMVYTSLVLAGGAFIGASASFNAKVDAEQHERRVVVRAPDLGAAPPAVVPAIPDGPITCPPGHHLVRSWNPNEKGEGRWSCEEPVCSVRVHSFEGVTCDHKDGLLLCRCTPPTDEVAHLRDMKNISDESITACWKQRDAMLAVPSCNAAWKASPR